MPVVYAAKYSNVPVWVCNIKNVSVMRRQADGWVNATHLLKVADFDKPKRTRVLERDVQSGQHEKVQGGYGKYQGTWIPLERAQELSASVGIVDLVKDLLDYVPTEGTVTEPLPRVQRASSKNKNEDGKTGRAAKRAKKSNSLPVQKPNVVPAQPMATMPAYGQNWMPQYSQNGVQVPMMMPYMYQQQPNGQNGQPQQYMQMSPMQMSPMQMAPHPQQHNGIPYNNAKHEPRSPSSSSVLSSGSGDEDERPYLGGVYRMQNVDRGIDPAAAAAARVRITQDSQTNHSKQSSTSSSSSSSLHSTNNTASQQPPRVSNLSPYMADYSSKLLDFFMSADKTVIPPALLNPTRGPHINQPIDDEGNTAFHWTCAIGRVEVMQALVDAGASIHALNNSGQKPLVRAVLFTNNYEARSFPKVLEMLAETCSFVDRAGRTILHHIANASSSGTRASSARYYAEILLAKLTASQELVGNNLAAFVNKQDHNGDTALHICGRTNARRLAKVLLSYNALPNIPNKAGITAEEIFQKNQFRTEPVNSEEEEHNSTPLFQNLTQTSLTTSRISKLISDTLNNFAKGYDKSLANKDSDINQVRDLLNQIQQRICEAENALPALEKSVSNEENAIGSLDSFETQVDAKSQQLRHLIERSQSRDLALLVQKEETDVQKELQEQVKQADSISEEEQFTLARELTELQARRAELLDEIIHLYSNSGSREKIKKYRKLLAVCCEVAEDEVDGLLDGITQALSA